MSGANQSNNGAASSDQQETNSPQTRGSVGPANSITNAIQNGDLRAARTETVLLASSSGTQSAIKASDLITILQQQNPIYGFPAGSTDYVVVPRHVDIWAGGNVILTARFNECAAINSQTVGMSKQFYAVGFEGADRCHFNFMWGSPAEVRPWVADPTASDDLAPVNLEVVNPFDEAANTTWVAKFTFTVFARSFFNLAPGFFLDKTPEEMQKHLKEQRGRLCMIY